MYLADNCRMVLYYMYMMLFRFSHKCIAISTSSNSLLLWARDWDLSLSGDVFYYHQGPNDRPIYGTVVNNAFHVSYQKAVRYESGAKKPPDQSNTFSASFYSDGSLRIRYHKVEDIVTDEDMSGLWGTRASDKKGTNTRYHREAVPNDLIKAGNDIIYCPFSYSIGCAEDSCVHAEGRFEFRWKVQSCEALQPQVDLECRWAGGLSTTIAKVFPDPSPTGTGRSNSNISCLVPTLNIVDGSLVTVDIRMRISTRLSMKTSMLSAPGSGHGSVLSATKPPETVSGGREVSWGHLMVRYYSAESSSAQSMCGCSAIPAYSGLQCDKCGVCGGNGSTVDCNGDCYGSAYIDSCGECAGGLSPIVPVDTCDIGGQKKNSAWAYIMDYIFAFVVMLIFFCLSLCTCFYIFCGTCNRLNGGNIVTAAPRRARIDGYRGLTADEIASIETFSVTPENHHALQTAESELFPGRNTAESSESECPICLGKYFNGEQCKRLPPPCSHVFHSECIDEWFKGSESCPLCKRSLRDMIATATIVFNNDVCSLEVTDGTSTGDLTSPVISSNGYLSVSPSS